ncbi:MAG: hypothetical protein KAT38_07375, partial [Bacteroidales bacterium]|nr:hypothetical protein [Bacteroidales bacterium]
AQFTLTDSLKAYYPFNNNANDESGNGHDGTVNGASITTDRFGNANSAYSFDGMDDYVNTNFNLTVTDQMTFNFWYFSESDVSDVQRLFGVRDATDASVRFVFYFGQDVLFDFIYNSNRISTSDLGDATKYSNGKWNMITLVKNGNTPNDLKIYLNTEQTNDNYNFTSVANYTPSIPIWLGAENWNNNWLEGANGTIDNFRIYNRPLSESEVLQLYANYYPPDTLIAEPGDEQITLSWDTTNWENLDKVYIYRDLALHDSVNITSISDTSYTDLDLINYQEYSYFIRSKDIWGNMSIPSDTITTFPCEIVTDYDGNHYKTTKIGNQIWMAENLKSINYADGTPLVDGTGVGNISGDYTTKYYFWYDDDSATYSETYGALYTWAAV